MNAMSPINAAMRLNCGESWFRLPVLNGEPCVGSEERNKVNDGASSIKGTRYSPLG